MTQAAQAKKSSTTHLGEALNAAKLEVIVIPVSDVDRAKEFYGSKLGWRLDADFASGDAFRVVQFTPPGSACSIHFGKGVTPASPGSARVYLVVSDIVAARAELIARGVEVSEVVHGCPGASTPRPRASRRRASWRAHSSARRVPTASTRSGLARLTRTGRTGTPRTW